MGDAQNQQRARKHKGDLQILRGRHNETIEYIEQIDFKEISLKDDGFEEVSFDGWPLLHTHYSRFLPAKIAIAALVDLMCEQKKPVVSFNSILIGVVLFKVATPPESERIKSANSRAPVPSDVL